MTKTKEAKAEVEDSEELDDLLGQAAAEGAEDGDDDEVDIDLSESVSYEAFTAKVPVEIVKATKLVGKDSGKPYVKLQLRIFEGEYEGRVVFTNLNLTGKGAGFGADKLKAFGYVIDPDRPKLRLKALLGLKAIASCAPDKREQYSDNVEVGKITRYVAPELP